MRESVKLTVKGTKYYKALELFERGALSAGMAVRLEHEAHNPYDNNAVAVKIGSTGAMLGYVSREVSRKYAVLANDRRITEARIASVGKNGVYVNIDIRVVYELPDEQLATKHNSRFWISATVMPAEAGVYAIRNINSGRQYIGSSRNIRDRIRSHIRDLSVGCHVNHALQRDFWQLGADRFEAKIVENSVTASSLAAVEAGRIASLLKSGVALYNLTMDGRGIVRNSRGYTDSEPVSDRFRKQRTETKQRRIDETYVKRRKAVSDSYDDRLEALLPKNNFWFDFVTTFLVAFPILLVVTKKMSTGVVFIVSLVSAYLIASLIKHHFQDKAKRTEQYRDLLRQRKERLNEIDDERGTM